MCGICGFYGPEDKKLLRAMNDVISHRGPDDKGYFSDSRCSLGMRRLAIIDVAKGHQPIHNEDESSWIVFNGEIYNYLELKSKLQKHRFYTGSDTEAILHAYEEFGEACLGHLNGMFAFAIWDSKKKLLFLARDRFGEKPLYYTFVGKRLFFASEIKSLLQNKNVKRQVNPAALHDYLSFRCNSTNETFFKGVFKLPPAHFAVYDGKSFSVKKYWNPQVSPDFSRGEQYFADQLYFRLKKSVEMRMMSEVPLGAYLSGGIDSGTVVGLMSTLSSDPVKTFSVGFEDDFDELRQARFLADHFKTNHREVIVRPDAISLLPDIVWHLDEPMSDPTCIPVYLLSMEIKPYATVVLTGDGSDELLYGYEQFKIMDLHRRYVGKVPGFLRPAIPALARLAPSALMDAVFKYSSSLGDKGLDRLRDFVLTDDPAKMYLSLVSIFTEKEKQLLYSGKVKIDLEADLRKSYFSGKYDFLPAVVKLDTDKILAENMLMRSDKNTMAFSVEQRVPFLDHTLAEFIKSIPPGLKLRGRTDKYILRKAMSRLIPKQTIERKKSRFFVPIHKWLEGELGDVSRQLIYDCGFFRQDYVDNIYKEFRKSRLYCSRQLWSLLVFGVWHKMFIEEGFKKSPKTGLGGFA